MPAELPSAFRAEDYLRDFYKDKVEEPAMQLVIWFLPNVLQRIPRVRRALDFGAGPTVHVAMILRHNAQEIYLSDYLPQNREELMEWVRGRSSFCWDPVAKMIASREGVTHGHEWATIEADTRKKVKGVLHCDMHRAQSVAVSPSREAHYDLVTTFFCVEYACLTAEEYTRAMCNIVSAVRPGGHFVMGGCLEEDWCAFGGRQFACLYLTEDLVLSALRTAGIDVDEAGSFHMMVSKGIFLLVGRRRGGEAKETRG